MVYLPACTTGNTIFDEDLKASERIKEIEKSHPDLFDLLVLDEAHEMANDGTAQERAAHRLTALGLPTLMLTGSVMNGYAESLFANLWALSRRFREEFRRDDRADFVARYGFRKRIVEDRDKDGAVVAFGSNGRITVAMPRATSAKAKRPSSSVS